jgi:hypothetical protein
MSQHFLLDASGNLPASTEDWYAYLARLEARTEADMVILRDELGGLDADGLISYCDKLLRHTDVPELLLMVYAQPDIVGKMGEKQILDNLGRMYNKFRTKVIDQPLFEQISTGLISGYKNHGGESFLPQFRIFLLSMVDPSNEFPVGPSFDRAMADHVASCPCTPLRNNDFNLSRLALAQVQLPLTLEVLIKQQMSIGAMDSVALMVVECFKDFKKYEGYIDVFRRLLGDDVFTDLCVQANIKTGAMKSVITLAPLLGEASFHNEAFFESQIRLDGKLHKSEYLAQLKYFPNFEQALPILANYLLGNLKSTLSQLADYGNQDFLRQIVGLAVRNGRGAEAYGYVIDAVRAPVNDTSLIDAFEVSREELIEAMGKNVRTSQVHMQVQRAWYILQTFTLDVGFETLHAVLPAIDAFFLKDLLEGRRGTIDDLGITLNHQDLVKRFPQIKDRLLEDALGL